MFTGTIRISLKFMFCIQSGNSPITFMVGMVFSWKYNILDIQKIFTLTDADTIAGMSPSVSSLVYLPGRRAGSVHLDVCRIDQFTSPHSELHQLVN